MCNILYNIGDDDIGGTPVPIPNTAVKHYNADGSTFSCARVGSCQAISFFILYTPS